MYRSQATIRRLGSELTYGGSQPDNRLVTFSAANQQWLDTGLQCGGDVIHNVEGMFAELLHHLCRWFRYDC